MVQLSHLYITTGRTVALTIQTFVSKVMPLLFNTLSRFIKALLPRSKCLLILWLQSASTVILEPKKIKSVSCHLHCLLLYFFPSRIISVPPIALCSDLYHSIYSIVLYGISTANTKKRCPFHYRELECKSRKSRNTWGNRQIWPWSTEWSRAKANKVLPRECTGHSKHPLPTTQEKTLHMDITTGQHRNQIDYILCSQRWRSSIQSAKARLGADCGSDHELLIAEFRLKLKKPLDHSGMT